MKNRIIYPTIAAAAFLFWIFLSDHSPPQKNEPASPIKNPTIIQPEVKANSVTLPVLVPKKATTLSGRYVFSMIEKQLKKDRARFALCLLRNKEFSGVRIQMILDWDGAGSLRRLGMTPEPGDAVKACISELISTWNLPSHPGLQPFSFRAILAPTGL